MATIILDESFYADGTYFHNKDYLNELLDIVSKYIDAEIAIFIPNANISDIWSQNNTIAMINQEIQKKGNFIIYDQYSTKPTSDIDFEFVNFSTAFIGEIHFLHDISDDVIILFPLEKHGINIKKIATYVFTINHITEELNSNLSKWISEGINTKNILLPTQDSPLPNTDLTNDYKKILDEKLLGKNINERIPIILEVSSEVLRRNGYKYDDFLSSINSTKNKIRKIYKNDDSSIIFGCIDIDTGSIEICYHNGKHNDEYGYDNESHNKHDNTGGHDIKLHK